MVTIVESEEWQMFFEYYKELPELWQIKSESYKNRDKRNKAWSQLLKVYQCIAPKATLESLKNKMTNIKTCYRRELKKIKQSEKSGAGADDVYVPTLWYFNHLDFLKDQEEPVMGTSSMENIDAGEKETDDECGLQYRPNKKQARLSHDTRQEFLSKAIDHLDNHENRKVRDEADIYGEGWAWGFRKLSKEQKLYAKKAMDEILLLGQLEKLTLNTVNIQLFLSETSIHQQPASVPYTDPVIFSPQPSNVTPERTTGVDSSDRPAAAPPASCSSQSSSTAYNFEELFDN